MTPDFNKTLYLEIQVKAGNPEILQGLEQWLELGLISNEQVKSIARNYLNCRIPEPIIAYNPVEQVKTAHFTSQVITPIPVVREKLAPRRGNISVILQAFKDELSVRWLLFLGVFLVVVSSGVLAATNWQRFPSFLQYLILWSYTVVFWGVGLWANNKQNLSLTAKTLQNISFLLIPINFWAIDRFGLWGYPWEWITVIISSFSLSLICSWQQQEVIKVIKSNIIKYILKVEVITFLVLCFLHWGWNIPNFNLIALYLAMIGTTVIMRLLPNIKIDSKRSLLEIKRLIKRKSFISKGLIFFALATLLLRAIFMVGIPISRLGLAIGICGWLIADLDRALVNVNWRLPHLPLNLWNILVNFNPLVASIWLNNSKQPEKLSSNNKIFQILGVTFMGLGWLVTVDKPLPWEAILISSLAIHFFWQRLQVYTWKGDILAIFFIGLQAVWLIRYFIPTQISQGILDFSVAVTNIDIFPKSIYAVGFFPYLLIWVWLTGRLYRQNKQQLANLGENLTLCLGVMLTLIGIINPTWRSLNLLFSTVTLGYITHRRLPIRSNLVWLTHIYAIFTIFSVIDWGFPSLRALNNLNILIWGIILLGLMLIEWLLSKKLPGDFAGKNIWKESNWFFGCLFASLSYLLLLYTTLDAEFNLNYLNQMGNCLWLITPITLTLLGSESNSKERVELGYFSSFSLIVAQIITFGQLESRIIGLAVASGLMFANIRYNPNIPIAGLHLTFILTLITVLLSQQIEGLSWLIAGGVIILTLWIISLYLKQKENKFAAIYSKATDYWGYTLLIIELFILSLNYLAFSLYHPATNTESVITCGLLAIAFIYRYRQDNPNFMLYGVGWVLEIALMEILIILQYHPLTIAIIHLCLALGIIITIKLPQSQAYNLLKLPAWENLALIYALITVIWRISDFTPYTGLIVIGVALIEITLITPTSQDNTLSYLALGAISFGIYDLIIYQLQQTSGGNIADGITILAMVAIIIALIYRCLVWYYHRQNKAKLYKISLYSLLITAHSHWVIASILKLSAANIAIHNKPQLPIIAITVSACLGLYALIQARSENPNQQDSKSDWWVYVGLVELMATGIYARIIWTNLNILDTWRVIIACVVALLIYQIPWRTLGWRVSPFKRISIIIPALTVLSSPETTSYLSLIAVALFYARIAYSQRNIRWSYISVGFLDWVIIRWLGENHYTEILFYITVIGLSILYITQFDYYLKSPSQRENRHNWRLIGSGIILLTALVSYQDYSGIIPASLGLLGVFLGLGLQIRAFLFLGTITFLMTVFYQLVILSFEYAFLKWIIGLILGILLITIAANFERSREQLIMLIQNWLDKLEEWE